ncbi:ral GTPase-activating protein subunit alpha-1-like isoform X2 [Paramacrobiotus metropolitanus]|nr:ral GTPase-activating protein subunit alpha-1-like isoform X2 [Paramacrobiotus metropolitanus]XP_055335296.1 ral GTPase-activating protein subunit alpha-1-like isoform X2 [Paramacrobiotus metropolitanus]
MFKPRGSDLQKSSSKLSDTKKDLKTRMKHLRIILDHGNAKESKRTLGEDTEEVFGLFVEYFHALDLALKQRGQKISKEDVETVLYALEKILLLLPEFIRTDPSQANVITTVLKRCLHPSSALRLRREAMRPFLLYYQILRESCPEELHHLFMVLVPGMHGHVPGMERVQNEENDIFENAPPLLLPPAGEKPPDNLTRLMYETLLDLLVSQVYRISWDDIDQYQASFTFLFDKFKAGYLSRIFPESRACITPVKGFYPASIECSTSINVDSVTLSLQIATMKWLMTFLQTPDSLKTDNASESKKRTRDNSVGSDSVDSGLVVTKTRESSGSFSAAFQNLLHFEVNVPGTSEGRSKPVYTSNVYLMVRQTLLASPSNIQLVHELFETALKFPLTEHGVIKRVVAVYESWIMAVESTKNSHITDAVDSVNHQQGYTQFAADQSTLKLFCASSVHPFKINLLASDYNPIERSRLLEEQEKICERIIFLYRCAILRLPMSLSTWECVLNTLIKVTQICMPVDPPKDRLSTLCGRLSVSLFQTLLVAWVKGTLSAYIASRLWDDLTEVLSTLTAWEELIVRWEKTLVLITKLFAEQVFNVKYDSVNDHSNQSGHSFSSSNQQSDDGTLVAEPPRCRSNASSSDTEGISLHFNGRNDHESGSMKSGSMEPDEYGSSPKDKEGTLKHVEEALSRRLRHISGSEDNDGTASNSDNFLDPSRSDSTPDSLRESLNSPLFYPLEFDRKRAASSCSWVSVMAGGQLQGWSPDSACALWFRVFGVIGPVNKIPNPASHKFALESVNRIVDMLLTIYDKKGISSDSLHGELSTSDRFVPVAIVAPLLFEALTLPETFIASQALALQSICNMTFHVDPIPKKFCMHLIRTFHSKLLSGNQVFLDVIFLNAGMRLFCSKVPNAFLLVEDFTVAATSLVESKNHELQLMSIRMLGSLLFYLKRLPASFRVLSPISDTFKLKPCHNSEVQAKIFAVILRYTNITCPSDVRIPAFHCVGNVLYSLLNGTIDKPNIVEIFLGEILTATENFSGDRVAEIVNILIMITNHAPALFHSLPQAVYKIIQGICALLRKIAAEILGGAPVSKDIEEVFIKLVLCLCEWMISVPNILSDRPSLVEGPVDMRTLIEQTLQTITNMPELMSMEQEDPVVGSNMEIKGKGKRGFSELLADRRFSADVGAVLASRNHADDEPPMTRRATSIFSRPVSDVAKDKRLQPQRAEIVPPHMASSRLHVLKLAGAYAARHMANRFFSISDEDSWALMSSVVSEDDDLPPSSILTDNLQVFSMYDMIISLRLMTRNSLSNDAKDFQSFPLVRIIVRDIAGKYCYDTTSLFGEENLIDSLYEKRTFAITNDKEENQSVNSAKVLQPSSTTDTSEPTIRTFADLVKNHSADVVLDIMKYVELTTPGLGLSIEHPWNEPGLPPSGISAKEEFKAGQIMASQSESMKEYVEQKKQTGQLFAPAAEPPPHSPPQSAFSYCSRILSQFGYAGMAKRQHFHLMKRTDGMFRDLKLLDRRPNRDFQKIAVIYVARGQEDKMSIMTNNYGSEAYERFINRLGWNVDLADHKGFRGGLPHNSWQFNSAVYFASATMEVIFHVATRVGALTTEDHTSKMKHIGNDEVQIVWSDHYRDYDRKILPTQFGDVIICIYPTEPVGLYRIQIIRRENIPPFGPLYDGAIVDEENLAGLVRNTALNAGQACRKSIKGFQYFFEERAEYLKSLIQNYTEEGTYEHFLSSIISPQPPKLNIPSAPLRDVPVMLRPSWRESTRRYNDKVRNSLQTKSGGDPDLPTVSLRYSLPPRSGSTSSGTDV